MRIKIMIAAASLLLLAPVLPFTGKTEANAELARDKSEQFSALAQLPTGGPTMNVRIYINGYSNPDECQNLHALLLEGGPSALLKALQKMKPIGRIAREGTVGMYDFKFIVSKQTADGRVIYAVADRPIGFLEAYYDTRSRDYPFGILQLNLKNSDKHEKGEGTLIYAAHIKVIDGDKVETENLSFAPIKLLGVRQL